MKEGFEVFHNISTGRISLWVKGVGFVMDRKTAYELAQQLSRAADQAGGGGQQSR